MKCVSASEAARILGVSDATVRNWRRAGHLRPHTVHPLSFALDEVLALEERIRTNCFSRLRKRANKSASEQRGDGAPRTDAASDPAHVLFLCALRLLERAGEIGASPPGQVDPEALDWRRPALREVMLAWSRRLGRGAHVAAVPDPDALLSRVDDDDRLGLLYQELSTVGRKSKAGAYFTPASVIDGSLAALDPAPSSFLDPCCGTGRYLLRAATRFGIAPDRLYGFDSDPLAVDIARVNLLLLYRDLDRVPNIRCLDSLEELATGRAGCDTNHLLGTVDAVATNPPWGGSKNRPGRREPVGAIRSGESFSLFLEKALRLVRPGGWLSFILPEAMLEIKTHADIRALLLAETSIARISLLGRVFPGVFTPVIRLDARKTPAPAEWRVEVVRGGRAHRTPQSRFAGNAGHVFDVAVTPRDEELLARIYGVEHVTLAGNADWALGIVTGDNARHVLDAPADGAEPVLRGKDVFGFAPREPSRYIRFRPEEFQQVAPERYFRAPEKLIYRFVSDTLVFAYDERRLLTLNSANIVIPRLPGMSMLAALAFLNSRVFRYVFARRFRTRKVLRGDLETLPFPLLPLGTLREIEAQVRLCMGGERAPAMRLDGMVFAAFGLRDADIAVIGEGSNARISGT